MIRAFNEGDIDIAKKVWEDFFTEEFQFPDFLKMLCAFVVTPEDSNYPICIGGVRTLAEVVLITDKNFSVRDRRQALYQVLSASQYVAERSGHDALHAFIQDHNWLYHLKRVGFSETKGKSLYLPL